MYDDIIAAIQTEGVFFFIHFFYFLEPGEVLNSEDCALQVLTSRPPFLSTLLHIFISKQAKEMETLTCRAATRRGPHTGKCL